VSLPRLPQLGSVIWAELTDANEFRKVRPAVVVTATREIAADQPLRVVAITTRLPVRLPEDHVLLPWDPQGKARSGLRRKCAAVATWLVEIQIGDIRDLIGILPTAVTGQILSRMAADQLPGTEPRDG
jgi:mRNA-degrading endonuclease toxin of MazEF toxin-antitoxin module